MTTAITNLAEQARTLYLQDRAREAVAAAEAAIRLGGSTAGLHNDLGVYRMAAGDFPGAEAALRTAIGMDPALVSAYSNLLEIRDAAISEELLAQMHAVAARGGLAEADAALLDFCISRCYRRRREPAREFAYLDRAKSVMARLAPWDAAGFAADAAAVMTMSAEQLQRFHNTTAVAPAPVLVCTMPRAGSTLLERIIASHSDVASLGEAGIATRATQATVSQHGLAQPLYSAWLTLPSAAAILATAYEAFRDLVAAYRGDRPRFCEKSANNDILLGLWLLAYPDAKVLHLRRDPLDVCLSCYQSYFSRGVAFSNRLTWVAERLAWHERLMDHWKRLFPRQVLTVEYEKLVGQPRAETGRMLEFLGLPWNDACLEFHRSAGAVRSASNWQVRQPLYQSSVRRWPAYREQLAEIMHLAKTNSGT